MSLLLIGGVAGAYAAGVVGLHRVNVWRRRRLAGGFVTLRRLDWGTLLDGHPSRSRGGGSESALDRALTDEAAARDDWLETLAEVRKNPGDVLQWLGAAPPARLEEEYLLAYLGLTQGTHWANLELAVFGAKRSLSRALVSYPEAPALFFVRALASSLLGFNHSAIDDMARAVYYSRQAPFYTQAVVDTAYIHEVRPALFLQCKEALEKVE